MHIGLIYNDACRIAVRLGEICCTSPAQKQQRSDNDGRACGKARTETRAEAYTEIVVRAGGRGE
jgi:hypothetical protein